MRHSIIRQGVTPGSRSASQHKEANHIPRTSRFMEHAVNGIETVIKGLVGLINGHRQNNPTSFIELPNLGIKKHTDQDLKRRKVLERQTHGMSSKRSWLTSDNTWKIKSNLRMIN